MTTLKSITKTNLDSLDCPEDIACVGCPYSDPKIKGSKISAKIAKGPKGQILLD